jgi:hypothetical protein
MHIQFITLTFHSRSEEQLQECLRLKKSATLLSAAIEALGSPLGPHPESDLATDLYCGSNLIANMDESDRWISFNLLKKSAISLSAAIGALGCPLGPHLESDLVIDLYSVSIPIAIMHEFDRWISFNCLKKSATSLPGIEALNSPLGPHPESDLTTNLYSGSTPIANMDESGISFNLLTKSTISLSAAIRASDSSLVSRPERDLATDLHSSSTPIAIKVESNHGIRFRRLQEIYNITTRGDQSIGLSYRNSSEN